MKAVDHLDEHVHRQISHTGLLQGMPQHDKQDADASGDVDLIIVFSVLLCQIIHCFLSPVSRPEACSLFLIQMYCNAAVFSATRFPRKG